MTPLAPEQHRGIAEAEPTGGGNIVEQLSLSDTLAHMPDVGFDEDFARSREHAEFFARGEQAWQDYQRTGKSRPTGEVFDRIQERIDTRRRQ